MNGDAIDTTELVWRFVAAYTDQHGFPPTTREVAKGCYLASPSSALYHLRKLQEAGKLKREGHIARNYFLSDYRRCR